MNGRIQEGRINLSAALPCKKEAEGCQEPLGSAGGVSRSGEDKGLEDVCKHPDSCSCACCVCQVLLYVTHNSLMHPKMQVEDLLEVKTLGRAHCNCFFPLLLGPMV